MAIDHSPSQLFLLQLSDSALPIGGYSNSWGLETWVQRNVLRTSNDVLEAIEVLLKTSLAPLDASACSLSWRCFHNGDCHELQRLNDYLTASRWPSETLSASINMGQRLARLAQEAGWVDDLLKQPAHHSTVFGWLAASQGVGHRQTVEAYLYSSCAGHVSACVRLVPLGHTDGQRILTRLRRTISEVAQQSMVRTIDELSGFSPMHEWACIEHESLYSRLFQS